MLIVNVAFSKVTLDCFVIAGLTRNLPTISNSFFRGFRVKRGMTGF